MLRAALAGAVILSVSCSKSESSEGLGPVASAGSAKAGSSSFSADLAKELGGGGSGSAAEPAKPTASSDPKAATAPIDPKPIDPKPSGDTKVAAPAPDPKAAPPAKDPKPPPADPKPPADTKASDGATAAKAPDVPPARAPVKVSGDLAAIKMSLLPNWDRDIEEAGTFQYVVRIKGTQSTKTFRFRYGYEDSKAPQDNAQYKKYLQESRVLTGDIRDRQRGAAWFLEGNDASGLPAFRYVVLYGGKRLICYGSLYKDADSNKLGDDRDQTLIQAKQICETLAL